MTIRDLLRGENTLTQLAILSRADVLFDGITRPPCGRYYGGELLTEDCYTLKPIKESK